jgi:subtilase family serine protease
MTQRLFVMALVTAVVSFTDIRAGQRPAEPARGAAAVPVVIAADRHDRSPQLRDVPPGRPPLGEAVGEREPKWRRVSRHPSGLLPDSMVQTTPAAAVMPTPAQSVEGIGNVNGVLPPDTNGDVGPNHFVQWVNLSFAVYSKGTSTTPPSLLYGPAAANTLWSGFGGPCETRNDGDPIVRYDHMADRWVMSQLAIPNSFFGLLFGPFYECIAVSATPDPLGAYYRYQFSFSKLNDYPKMGVWSDGYYMAVNEYSAISVQFAGQGVVAFDRDKMLAGLPASAIYYDLASVDMNLGGMLPADLDGPAPPAGSPAYFVQVDDDAWGAEPDQLQIWKFQTDWANPALSSFTRVAELPTAPFDSNLCDYARNCIPQPGTTAKVDAMSDRLMYRLQYRNFGTHESLVVNHTVDADGTDHAGIRWYEVRNPGTSPVIYQQGTYAPDFDHRWMGSAAMDSAGNIALGFSVSGALTFPSIRYTGRLATDPLNVMTLGEADLMVGSGSQLHASGRWGDYSSLVVDPVDDCTFWYTQEYYAVTSEAGWQTRIGSFSLPNCQSSSSSNLPAVSIAATTPSATEAGPTSGAFTVTRTGDTSLPLTVFYTVGGTATAGADYAALPGTVTIAAGDAAAVIPVVPVDDPVVEPNESVIVAPAPDSTYVLGSGGAVVTIVSDDLPPDLIVTTLTGPTIAGAGLPITLNDTTKNQGSGPAQQSVTGFFLSTNTTLDAADVSLGTRAVPLLAPGASDSASTVLTVPSGTTVGTYYVLAKADVGLSIAESNETNNVKAASVAVGPDLVVAALTVPASGAAGGSITVADTTKNQGGGSSAVSVTSFYLSANVLLDGTDVLLGSRPTGPLAPGVSETASTTLSIPAGTATGTYYIIAKADGTGVVPETQELNNTKFGSATKIGPDLIESSTVVPAVAGAGIALIVSETVKNQGSDAAGASTTSFYLSTNLALDGNDAFLGNRSVPALGVGATSGASTVLVIPAGTATGTFYVLVKADANNDVVESVETNNISYGGTRVGPDLFVAGLTLPASAVAGATISATDTVKNAGGGVAAVTTTRFYLSTNFSFDSADVLIGSRTVPALDPGATDAGTASLTIPAQTAASLYYIIAVTDADDVVTETAENNNTRALAIKITSGS